MAKTSDAVVIAAMGDKYEELRELARIARDEPSRRREVEKRMGAILDSMSPGERLSLRRALVGAGVR